MKKFLLLLNISTIFICSELLAEDNSSSDSYKHRYASLKTSETNVRSGPGMQYPIRWIFKRRKYPVKIISEYQLWYKIVDPEGEEGWIYKNLVSGRRTVITKDTGRHINLYKKASHTQPFYRMEAGVILELYDCGESLCRVKYNSYAEGWIVKEDLLMVD